MKKLEIGELLQVGDTIKISNCFGVGYRKITRVTKRFAVAKEVKYQREVKHNMSCPYYTWDTNTYECYRDEP